MVCFVHCSFLIISSASLYGEWCQMYYQIILFLQAGNTGTSEEGDISQRQLELQYSRVVQAAFLYSRVNYITCDFSITCE